MARTPERKGLGRGLSALLGDIDDTPVSAAISDGMDHRPVRSGSASSAPIEKLHPNPDQPRRQFPERELDELATSIRERGIIQPIIVRPDPRHDGDFQIVAGERRWRAAQRAPLHEVPIVVRELDDRTVLELALIENIQRADLNPLEEAQGYATLMEAYAYTQETLAEIVGKSRSHLANTLRLLNLPVAVADMVRNGKLSAGHARALMGASDPVALAETAVAKGLTVRQVEHLARQMPGAAKARRAAARAAPQKDADTRLLEGDLSAVLGMKVSIDHRTEGNGTFTIRYNSLDQLDQICQKLVE